MKKKEKKIKIKGHYFKFDINEKVKENDKSIDIIRSLIKNHNTRKSLVLDKEYKNLVRAKVVLGVKSKNNIIAKAGTTVMMKKLIGDTSYTGDGEVDYGALGNAVAPSFDINDTQLENEVFRKTASSRVVDENIAYVDWFISAGDVADGTFTEFGSFIDGTASADSGEAFSLLATGDWVKSGSIYISAKYTLN